MDGRVHVNNGIDRINLHDCPLMCKLILLGRIRGEQGSTIVLLTFQMLDRYAPCQLSVGRVGDGEEACLVRHLNSDDAIVFFGFCVLCSVSLEDEALLGGRQVE